MTTKGNRYNDEFKADIIRLIQEESQPANKVAKDFGMNDQTIRNWLKATEIKQDPVNNRVSELEAQLKDEKRKNAELEQTINVLKNPYPFSFKTTGSSLCFYKGTHLQVSC